MRCRLISRITSPRWIPASAAELPSSTRATMTPSLVRRLSCRATSGVIGRTSRPSTVGERPLAAIAPHLHLAGLPGRGQAHGTLQVGGRVGLLALELEQDVAGLEPRL